MKLLRKIIQFQGKSEFRFLKSMANEETNSPAKGVLALLLASQLFLFVGMYMSARTTLMWFYGIISFVPALLICLYTAKKKYVLPSLILLFISQQAIWIFANNPWGFAFGSDAVNDLHMATVLSETNHFTLGQLGYTQRLSYSYYPMVHLFAVTLSKVTSLPLNFIAVYIVPFTSTALVTIALYGLNGTFFKLSGRQKGLATLLFQASFFYTAFQWQFIREVYAFPLTLLTLWVASKVAADFDKKYVLLATLLIFAIVFSHQMSSYLLIVLLAVMTLSYSIFHRNHRLWILFFLTVVILGGYTRFVTMSFSTSQINYTLQGLQVIFDRSEAVTVLRRSSEFNLYLTYTYYLILAFTALVGILSFLRKKRRNWEAVSMIGFLTFAFLICVMLRLSISANPWNWAYYMALRGTIWGFVGISVAASAGIFVMFRLKNNKRAAILASVILIAVLAAGKFAQYNALVTDTANTPVTESRYMASTWLRDVSIHGSNMLIASYSIDNNAFEASRSMSPYAFLKEFFIDENENWSLADYTGYVPFVGEVYEQYNNGTSHVNIIYSNGDTKLGFKGQ